MTPPPRTLAAHIVRESRLRSAFSKALGTVGPALKEPTNLYAEEATFAPSRDGDQLPPRQVEMRFDGRELLNRVLDSLAQLIDVTATKDYGNCEPDARVDVRDPEDPDKVLIRQAPTLFLIFLVKKLEELQQKIVEQLPVLDPDWKWESAADGTWVSDTRAFPENVVLSKPVVYAEETERFPAQAVLTEISTHIGDWHRQMTSTAFPADYVHRVDQRCSKLLEALQLAIEEANQRKVSTQRIGATLMDYLFRP